MAALDSDAIVKTSETILAAQDIIDWTSDEDEEDEDKSSKTEKKKNKSSDKSSKTDEKSSNTRDKSEKARDESTKASDKSTKTKDESTKTSDKSTKEKARSSQKTTAKAPRSKDHKKKEAIDSDEGESSDEIKKPHQRKAKSKIKGKGRESEKEDSDDESKKNTLHISDDDDTTDSVDASSETSIEEEIHWVQETLDKSEVFSLEDIDQKEFNFWNLLKVNCLKPEDKSSVEKKRTAQLKALRNGWLIVLALVNILVVSGTIALDWFGYLQVSSDNNTGITLAVLLLLPTICQFLSMVTFRIAAVSSQMAKVGYHWKTGSHHPKWSFHVTAVQDSSGSISNDQSQMGNSGDASSTVLLQP